MPSTMIVFVRLLRAEWLKSYKRPLVWVLLGIFLLLLIVQLALQYFVAALAQGLIGGVELRVLPEAQLAQYRSGAVLPGAWGTTFGHANGLGGIFAIILAAASLGNEYGWGTLRTLLARQPRRGLFLLAKVATLLALLAVALLAALVVATPLGLVFGGLLGVSARLDPVAALPLALLRALYVLLPYVLLTLLFAAWGRSTLAGVAGGLIYLVFEVGLGGLALGRVLGGFWAALYNLTIGQNINALVVANSRAFGLDPGVVSGLDLTTLPPVPQAVAVIAVYCASFLLSAIWLLRRRDIHGPS
jgi:ABC-2 type transport system permease protein